MTSPTNLIPDVFESLCGLDQDTKSLARKYYVGIQRIQRRLGGPPLPEHADTICAFLASESVHAAAKDKVVTYLVALERFGRKREMQFWRTVSQIEELLVQAAKDPNVKPIFNYSRKETFDEACEQCSNNNIPCYKVPAGQGKRSSKKCIPCFTHNRSCKAGGEVNDAGDPDWSPPKRSLSQKIEVLNGRTKAPNTPIPSSRNQHPIATASNGVRQAESSKAIRRHSTSQRRASPTPTSQTSSAPSKSLPVTPVNKTAASPRTLDNRPRNAAVCKPKTDTEASRDPRKRTQSVVGSSTNAAPAATLQPGQGSSSERSSDGSTSERSSAATHRQSPLDKGSGDNSSGSTSPQLPAPSLSTVMDQYQRISTSRAKKPSAERSTAPLSRSSLRTPGKQGNSPNVSSSGIRKASTLSTTPQRERFATPVMDIQGAELGYLGLPMHLDPVISPESNSTAGSSGGSLRTTPARPREAKPAEDKSSPSGAKRASEMVDDDKRKKRKLDDKPSSVVNTSSHTPRRKSLPGAGTREASRASPAVQYTPPQSRNASPAVNSQNRPSQPVLPTTPTTPASLVMSVDASSYEPQPRTSTPRLPTPVSPSVQNENLPDFIQADLAMHAASGLLVESVSSASRLPSSSPMLPPSQHEPPPQPLPPLSVPPTPPAANEDRPVQGMPFHRNVQVYLPNIPGPSTIQIPAASTSQVSMTTPTPLPSASQAPAPATLPLPFYSAIPSQAPTQLPVQLPPQPPAPAPQPQVQPSAPRPPQFSPSAVVVAAATAPQYADFVEVVYHKAKEIVKYCTDNAAVQLHLKFAIEDMRLRLAKIDTLKARAGSGASEKHLPKLKQMLLAAGKTVVSRMVEEQRTGQMDDIILETMIEELAGRLEEMEKPRTV